MGLIITTEKLQLSIFLKKKKMARMDEFISVLMKEINMYYIFLSDFPDF